VIPPGHVVTAVGDVTINASRKIEIDGDLYIAPGATVTFKSPSVNIPGRAQNLGMQVGWWRRTEFLFNRIPNAAEGAVNRVLGRTPRYWNREARIRTLEEHGLTGVEVPQVYGPPFVPLAVAATVTKQIQLASGIAIGLTRSPFETAMAALDLDRLSPGTIYLGTGDRPHALDKGLLRDALRQTGLAAARSRADSAPR
jgi:hypothetical protein